MLDEIILFILIVLTRITSWVKRKLHPVISPVLKEQRVKIFNPLLIIWKEIKKIQVFEMWCSDLRKHWFIVFIFEPFNVAKLQILAKYLIKQKMNAL